VDVESLRKLLEQVAREEVSVGAAIERLRALPFESLDFATVDHHRALRCGCPEVIFCQGKTPTHVVEIARRLASRGVRVLATRASSEHREALSREFGERVIATEFGNTLLIEDLKSRISDSKSRTAVGPVAVICAGTADLPVAEEAAMTLRAMDVPCERIHDVGVSGLHRLLAHVETLQQCCAIVVIAGMEGALPSVVGGLVACPVFAVPTSAGYGASFGGVAALLAMLNSCASNVSVVNIDNGFGAAYSAGMVWNVATKGRDDGD
jgi:NCAIR mutase (PurE)-related protein